MPALVSAFGTEAATADGALDRAYMRRLVFADPSARKRLEAILHPMIRALSAERCQLARTPYVILAVPLLLESGTYRQRCNRIAVVDCPESLQISRVMARSGLSEDDVRAIMVNQASRDERLAIADDVIANDSDLAALESRVGELHCSYLRLSSENAKANC